VRHGKILLYCHANCDTDDILIAVNLRERDLFLSEEATEYHVPPPRPEPTHAETVRLMTSQHQQFRRDITADMVKSVTDELGVAMEALDSLEMGLLWPTDAVTFPERDGAGQVIGIQRRYPDGSKYVIAGGKRGLFIPVGFAQMLGPIFVPEGASDTAAILSMGRTAVGRPSCSGGVSHLIQLFRNDGRDIIVVGDNDEKNGRWPGRDGAIKTAQQLQEALQQDVKWVMPPEGFKDIREYLIGGAEDVLH